jgi:hypothetical protein
MPHRPPRIDSCWAESLLGLRVRIPDHNWIGYTGSYLYDGKLTAFDVVNQKWLIELDDQDDDDEYRIAYDDVCEYSNKQHSTFNRYQLPYKVVLEGDDEIETEDGTLYSLTPSDDWTLVDDDDGGRSIEPIQWTGENEEFSVNITDTELDTLMDDSKEIRFEKGEVPLKLTFCERAGLIFVLRRRCADSPKFLRIEYKIIPSS